MSQVNVLCATWEGGSTLVSELHDTPGGTMTTAIFDADSHLMETPEWLGEFADASVRERLAPLGFGGAGSGADKLMASLPDLWASQREADIGPEVLKGPKGWMAPGALDADVRTRVLDALGIAAQLVFPTFSTEQFAFSKDLDVLYGGADALNRAMASFCASRSATQGGRIPAAAQSRNERSTRSRPRSMPAWPPSGCPRTRPGTSRRPTSTSSRCGPGWPRRACPSCSTWVGASCCPRPSTTTDGPGPRTGWAAARTCAPRTSRCCTTRPSASSPAWCSTGCSSGTPGCAAAPLSSGPVGFPGLLRNLDHAFRSFHKFEPALGELSLPPSDYLRRQVCFTPFPFEDTAWLVEQCGPELFMFSTDYPHPEGGKRPFEAFGEAVAGFDEATQERFFWRNGAELLGLA